MLNKIRYGVGEIRKNAHDPGWWYTRFNARVVGPTLSLLYKHEGIDMMDRDWDNLLIMDATRADVFEEEIDTDQFESYERVKSPGSSSPEWMQETFAGKEFPDTVYVTANPWIEREAPDSFHQIIDLWIEEKGASPEDFRGVKGLHNAGFSHEDYIPADAVTEWAMRAQENFPDKRIIVHYFQPHGPFIGNSDGSLRETPAERSMEVYRENLHYVFYHAQKCAEALEGRSVFTADHGHLFDDRLWPFPQRESGHPSGLHHPKLTTVPWAVETHGERREIRSGRTTEREVDIGVINDRLEDLGYKV